MTPAVAAPVFVASIAVMLLASSVFARRLDHIGLRLGLPETVLGVLTALATDAPEISSAISALVQNAHAVAVGVVVGSNAFNLAAMLGLSAILAGRVRARHEALELEGFVALWVVAVACAVAAGGLGATSRDGPQRARRPPLRHAARGRARDWRAGCRSASAARVFVQRSFGERHRRERTLDSRREIARLAVVLLVALCLIVAGSIGAVRSALDLAHAWSVPQVFVGVIVLSILTSLPEAWTGIRFGLQGRGSALMSDALNSNSINVARRHRAARGGRHPCRLLSPRRVRPRAGSSVMTAAALLLFGRRGGGGRSAGVFLIVLYVVFLAVQIAVGG